MTRALVLVAHPDDETIFAGGVMLAHPEWEWTIVTATHSLVSDRGDELRQAVFGLRARGVNVARVEMLGMNDAEGTVIGLAEYIKWERAIASACVSPDRVYTHNKNGDYGHGHHMAVNAAAHVLYPEAELWEFYYPRQIGVPFATPGSRIERYVSAEKREIFKEAYEHRLAGLLHHLPEWTHWHILDAQEMHTCVS